MAPIVLILGSGPRVGKAVSKAFDKNGYQVAIASRKGIGGKTEEGYLSIKTDLNKPEAIPAVFAMVKKTLGAPPNVVIYNAPALTPPPDQKSPLSIPLDAFAANLTVNVTSAFAAAQEALKGWAEVTSGPKLYIYTGNAQNDMIVPMPLMMNLGVGKAATANWIGVCDTVYKPQGYRFIYADERKADGGLKGAELDAEAHGEFYSQLAKSTDGIPWQATFVKGKGYVSFK